MGAIADIWHSERGLIALAIIVAATVLAALGRMSIGDWQTFVLGVFIAYAAGKTATGVASIIKGVPDPIPPTGVPAPAPEVKP